MPRSNREAYNVLLTQNYLRAISQPSPELATKVATHGEPCNPRETRIQIDGSRVMWTVGGQSQSLEEEDDDSISSPMICSSRRVTVETRPRASSASLPEIQPLSSPPSAEGRFSQSMNARKASTSSRFLPSRVSLLQRLSRILSSEEIEVKKSSTPGGDSARSDALSESPSSLSQTLIKRIRSTITKGERSVLCTTKTCYPVAVVAAIPQPQVAERRRRKDRREKASSSDRIHTLVSGSGELRPLEFKEHEELTYGRLLRLRRSRLVSAVMEKSAKPTKKSYETLDVSLAMVDLNKSSTSLAAPAAADADEVLNAQRHTAAEYDPKMIADVEASLRTTVKGLAYIATTRNCLGYAEHRKLLNDRFRSLFPALRITYTKLRSIKREMVTIANACKVDNTTLAHAFVYYERIVLQGRISKSNRKEIAAACFLVAVKICDTSDIEMSFVFERLESTFRLSHSEILSFELPVCLALSFDLMPPLSQLQPHYSRLQLTSMI